MKKQRLPRTIGRTGRLIVVEFPEPFHERRALGIGVEGGPRQLRLVRPPGANLGIIHILEPAIRIDDLDAVIRSLAGREGVSG